MSEFFKDFIGVIGSPGPTIGRLMAKKRWQAALAIILLVTAVATFITFPIAVKDNAIMMRDSSIAEKMSDEQLINLDRVTVAGRFFATFIAILVSILVITIGAFFIYLFFKIGGAEGFYVHYFTGVAFASILDMGFGGILRTLLVLSKKTVLIHTGLVMFFPGLDSHSLLSIFLRQFDFFSLWYLVALALGISVFTKFSLKKSIFITSQYFLFKCLVAVPIAYIWGKFTGI
jgi:hypothetical protein